MHARWLHGAMAFDRWRWLLTANNLWECKSRSKAALEAAIGAQAAGSMHAGNVKHAWHERLKQASKPRKAEMG